MLHAAALHSLLHEGQSEVVMLMMILVLEMPRTWRAFLASSGGGLRASSWAWTRWTLAGGWQLPERLSLGDRRAPKLLEGVL